MTFPLLFTVGLHVYSAGSDDGYGNAAKTYTPAKNLAGTSYKVFGWSQKRVEMPDMTELTDDRDRVITDLQLYAPATFPATPYDVVDVDGVQYEVLGPAEDYNNGPWWVPNLVVWNLRKVTG